MNYHNYRRSHISLNCFFMRVLWSNEFKLNPHIALGRNRTQATLVGGERSHHCAIPSPLKNVKAVGLG